MKRRKTAWVLAFGGLGIMLWFFLRFYALVDPKPPVGLILFKTSYFWSRDKGTFLKNYSESLTQHGGGYIPEPVDTFLCSRLQSPGSEAEMEAVSDFYVLKAGGREGARIFELPVPVRQRVVGYIMSQLERYPPSKAANAMVLVEVMRRGQNLGKARLISTQGDTGAYPAYQRWLERQALPLAKASFQKWCSSGGDWRQKAARNPLEGSGLEISAP